MVIYVFALRKLFSAFHTEKIREIQLVGFSEECTVHGVHWTEYKWCNNGECKQHVIQ